MIDEGPVSSSSSWVWAPSGGEQPLIACLRSSTRYTAGFPSPRHLAAVAGCAIEAVALPAGHTHLTDGRTIWYAPHPDRRERGTRIFRGLASAILGQGGGHSQHAGWYLAGRLAAPPLLVRRVGIDAAVELQTWATEEFLRAWWAAVE